jgi:RNA polymerase sigma-70 factor, ECF subfamily
VHTNEATAVDRELLEAIERHRKDLHAHCYRMLGSLHDAEDAVQEVMLRAWRGLARFEGRSSLRTWLYTIATNTCLTAIARRPARALPIDYGPAADPHDLGNEPWIEPYPDDQLGLGTGLTAPEARYERRESVELAFVAALQHLAPRPRAVLMLREVLGFSAREVAEALDTTVASVNSALHRARATLGERELDTVGEIGAEQQELLDRYADAFERYDMTALVGLLHDDAVMSMPPYALWLVGTDDIVAWHIGPGAPCARSKMVPVTVNGMPGFAQYKPAPEGDGYVAWAIQAPEIRGDKIVRLNAFLDVEALFPMFGLPLTLEGSTAG